MARTDHQLKPSRDARVLYGQLVARADHGHINLDATVRLGAERVQRGKNVEDDGALIKELCGERWLAPASDGGWRIAGVTIAQT